MTMYSLLTAQNKTSVIATWPGGDAESYSAKVTTFTDIAQAAHLARELTHVSEAMWDAAAWLDVYHTAETTVAGLVASCRGTDDIAYVDRAVFGGCRHETALTTVDLRNAFCVVGHGLPDVLNTLSRAQRLSVADELEIDAGARAESLRLLPTGYDPDDDTSRVWQAADITAATRIGLTGHLPEGAGGWLVRIFDSDRSPAERWGARNLLHRLEQLETACDAVGGRGMAEIDDYLGFRAHLNLPAALFGVDRNSQDATATVNDNIDPSVAGGALSQTFRDYAARHDKLSGDPSIYITPDIEMRHMSPWDRDVFAKIVVTMHEWGETFTLATLDATDTAGFIAALGPWAGGTVYRS